MTTSKFPPIALVQKVRPHQVASLGAIASVLRSRGYKVRETYDQTAPEPIVFCWSWGKAMIQRQKHPDSIICCLDHGYTIDRAKLINTGWSLPSMECGLNGFAEHAWVDDPSRAEKMGWVKEIEPYRATPQKRALLLGQVYGDAMIVTQVRDYGAWLRETSAALTEEGYTVSFRPHPVMVRRGQALAYGNLGRIRPHGPLRADLLQADLAVGLNSNGLVEAFLSGIQARFYNGGSMLSPLVDIPPLERVQYRREWLNRLAWAQWRLEELGDGSWFKVHEPIMRRLVQEGTCVPWSERRL